MGQPSIFDTLSNIDQFETQRREELDKGRNINKIMWLVAVVFISLAFIAGLKIWFLGGPDWLRWGAVICYLLAGVILMLSPLVEIPFMWGTLTEIWRNPFNVPLRNVKIMSEADLLYLPALMGYSVADLENALLEIRSESEYFGRRVHLMIGAIEKVGLFPALLALAAVIKDISNWNWAFSLAIVNFAVFVMGVYSNFLIMRLDRKGKLLEVVIARKKEK